MEQDFYIVETGVQNYIVGGKKHRIEKIINHSKYVGDTVDNDIALIKVLKKDTSI